MSDKQSSDEEPNGGRLATGAQPASDGGKAETSGPPEGRAAEGQARAPEPPKPTEAKAPASAAASAKGSGAASPVQDAAPGSAAEPSPGTGSTSSRSDGAGPASTAAAGRSDGAGPGPTRSADSADGPRPAPAPQPAGAADAVDRAGGDAKPASSAGPAAEAPPPWRRVPGEEISEPAPPAPSAHPAPVAGGLFDAPTAFIDRPTEVLAAPDQAGGAGGAHDGSGAETNGSAPTVRVTRGRPPRQAALQLKRLDPWSVLKLAAVLAVVLFFIWLVAVGVLYGILGGMGVWDRLNGTYADLVSGETHSGSTLISAGPVLGFAAVVGAINSLLFAVALTIGAFIYNVSADLVGGIEVTLSERD
ncbi:DUF3566 domain-containing protein [Pseudonocardia hispaniensis]|uniref:DUF3566 domain-containing protein n=1 Tax=Pseudonocardia hispaniensis TaxID=904933 RepID=A0ABW1J6H8_9PSEU